jgi:ATP-dependent HslUV protease subunit HslV
MVVCDKDHSLMLTGSGDVQDFPDGIIAIGSGGPYAFASAKALSQAVPDMDVEEIAQRSMKIAADICIYTNHNFVVETLTYDPATSKASV